MELRLENIFLELSSRWSSVTVLLVMLTVFRLLDTCAKSVIREVSERVVLCDSS